MKVVFHQRLSSNKGQLPRKVVFQQRSSSTKGCLQLKVVFSKRLSATGGCLPTKVVFHQMLSPNEGHLQMKVVFKWLIFKVLNRNSSFNELHVAWYRRTSSAKSATLEDTSWAWLHLESRPGKCCKTSSSGKFKAVQCPQDSVISNKGWTEIVY